MAFCAYSGAFPHIRTWVDQAFTQLKSPSNKKMNGNDLIFTANLFEFD